MSDTREIRGFLTHFEARAEGDKGIIKGRPVVFDKETDMGWYREIIDRNALADTDLRDIRLCLDHDTSFVYARSRNNNANSTMRVGVDNEGLYFEADLDLRSAKANDLYIAVERGDMDKMSFMFVVDGYEWRDIDSDKPLRIIRSISVIYELSIVTFPAYDDTSVQAASSSNETLESVRASLESVREEARKLERRKQVIRILAI